MHSIEKANIVMSFMELIQVLSGAEADPGFYKGDTFTAGVLAHTLPASWRRQAFPPSLHSEHIPLHWYPPIPYLPFLPPPPATARIAVVHAVLGVKGASVPLQMGNVGVGLSPGRLSWLGTGALLTPKTEWTLAAAGEGVGKGRDGDGTCLWGWHEKTCWGRREGDFYLLWNLNLSCTAAASVLLRSGSAVIPLHSLWITSGQVST